MVEASFWSCLSTLDLKKKHTIIYCLLTLSNCLNRPIRDSLVTSTNQLETYSFTTVNTVYSLGNNSKKGLYLIYISLHKHDYYLD